MTDNYQKVLKEATKKTNDFGFIGGFEQPVQELPLEKKKPT